MPLSAPPEKKSFFKSKVNRSVQLINRAMKDNVLDTIFILLIFANFFTNLKYILALFIVLYFVERLDIINKLTIKNQPTHELAEEKNKQ